MRRKVNVVNVISKRDQSWRGRLHAQLFASFALCFGLVVAAAVPASAQNVATPVNPGGGGGAAPSSNAPTVTLPGGATSLQETHDDWVVACSVVDNQKRCEFSQALGNKQSGKRILSIELEPQGNNIRGIILAPFGLKLASGVSLKVDDKPILQQLAFTTCIEAGCLVPMEIDGKTASVIGAGNQMTFNATNAGNGQAVTLTISLKGFTAARNRAAQLMK